jgi:hypothetical protein
MLGIGLGVTSVQQGIGLISDPGSGPEGSTASANFAAGTYDGVEDLSDFLAENTAWGMFDPATVVDGIGLTDPDANSNAAPVLATALATELLADGFSAVFTYTRTAAIGVLCGITIEMLDLPDFNNEWIVGCVGADGTGYIFDAPTTAWSHQSRGRDSTRPRSRFRTAQSHYLWTAAMQSQQLRVPLRRTALRCRPLVVSHWNRSLFTRPRRMRKLRC